MRNRSCHGDPSVFSFSSKTCTGCPGFDTCVGQTHDVLLQLKVGAPVKVLLERHMRFDAYRADKMMRQSVVSGKRELTGEEEQVAKRLPVKTASQYRRLVSEGFIPRMQRALAQGSNPFDINGYKYLHIAFNALLAGGFTKRELRLNYMGKCGWAENTAFSAVSMIWHLFVITGVATEEGDALRPTTTNHNT